MNFEVKLNAKVKELILKKENLHLKKDVDVKILPNGCAPLYVKNIKIEDQVFKVRIIGKGWEKITKIKPAFKGFKVLTAYMQGYSAKIWPQFFEEGEEVVECFIGTEKKYIDDNTAYIYTVFQIKDFKILIKKAEQHWFDEDEYDRIRTIDIIKNRKMKELLEKYIDYNPEKIIEDDCKFFIRDDDAERIINEFVV